MGRRFGGIEFGRGGVRGLFQVMWVFHEGGSVLFQVGLGRDCQRCGTAVQGVGTGVGIESLGGSF